MAIVASKIMTVIGILNLSCQKWLLHSCVIAHNGTKHKSS